MIWVLFFATSLHLIKNVLCDPANEVTKLLFIYVRETSYHLSTDIKTECLLELKWKILANWKIVRGLSQLREDLIDTWGKGERSLTEHNKHSDIIKKTNDIVNAFELQPRILQLKLS